MFSNKRFHNPENYDMSLYHCKNLIPYTLLGYVTSIVGYTYKIIVRELHKHLRYDWFCKL